MADLADVETALKALIIGWLYPNGVTPGEASAAGMPVYVARGWPTKESLAASFKANAAQISIYSQPGSERLTTRYPRAWLQAAPYTGTTGQATRELRRQERLFQITIWTVTPEQRDALASLVDAKFAGSGDANGLEFITLPDGFQARLQYVRTAPTDKDELSGSFRRDLIYSVEYATTEAQTFDVIQHFETKVTVAGTLVADFAKP